MNLNSRLGKPDDGPEEPTGEEAVLLALVVSVMSVVANEAAKEIAGAEGQNAGSSCSAGNQLISFLPAPNRELTPEQVIKVQLSALKLNDESDAGIRKLYEFLSAANQETIGTVEAFVEMMKSPLFHPLLGFSAVELGRMACGPGYVEQIVNVVPAGGAASRSYLFTLLRETFGENAGCWLLDSITKA